MAEKKQKKAADTGKFTTKPKKEDLLMKILNRGLGLLNIAVIGLIIYQCVQFVDIFSKKGEVLFSQGRIVSIGVKDNKLTLNDLSDEEIAKKQKDFEDKKNGKEPEGLIGPVEAPKTSDDFVGPRTAEQSAKKTEEPAPAPAEPAKPVDYSTANLGIIITEAGMKNSELEQIKQLPKEVSLAFSPYADELDVKLSSAKRDGHEVLLNIMLHPASFPMKDNGNLSIQENYENQQNVLRFENTAKITKGYIGFLGTDNEIITKNIEKFTPVLQKIKETGLFFGYFRTNENANLDNDLKPLAVNAFSVKYLVDEEVDEDKIIAQLNLVKEDLLLKKKKLVIAIHPRPVSIRVLKAWLDENLGENIQIAPVSYFVINN